MSTGGLGPDSLDQFLSAYCSACEEGYAKYDIGDTRLAQAVIDLRPKGDTLFDEVCDPLLACTPLRERCTG